MHETSTQDFWNTTSSTNTTRMSPWRRASGTVLERLRSGRPAMEQSVPRRRTMIKNVTFVQNTTANLWLDLNEFLLPERS